MVEIDLARDDLIAIHAYMRDAVRPSAMRRCVGPALAEAVARAGINLAPFVSLQLATDHAWLFLQWLDMAEKRHRFSVDPMRRTAAKLFQNIAQALVDRLRAV